MLDIYVPQQNPLKYGFSGMEIIACNYVATILSYIQWFNYVTRHEKNSAYVHTKFDYIALHYNNNYVYISTYMHTHKSYVNIASVHGIAYLIQNTFGVKKARPIKVESYLEVNT